MRGNIVFLLLVVIHTSLRGDVTILASDFNKQFSCLNPFIATETTTIILDEDIQIEGVCELIQAGVGFNVASDRIIFTSAMENRVLVTQESTWIIALIIQFIGDAHLEKEPGAGLYLMNETTLFMSGNSKYITIPVESSV